MYLFARMRRRRRGITASSIYVALFSQALKCFFMSCVGFVGFQSLHVGSTAIDVNGFITTFSDEAFESPLADAPVFPGAFL